MPRRPFDAADASIAVATAVAAALLVISNDREVADVYRPDWIEVVGDGWGARVRSIAGPALRVDAGLHAMMIVVTLGLGVSLLRRPGAFRRGRWPRPGVAAIAVAALGVVFKLAEQILNLLAAAPGGLSLALGDHPIHDALQRSHFMPKGAVLGAWALLLVAGRWRRGRDGLDRAGRLLGWAWLGLIGGDVMRACLW